MCKWGKHKKVKVKIQADISHSGKEREAIVKVDKCLAPLVKMLNRYGIKTTSCCCGHGKTTKSYIGIQGKNIHVGTFENTGLISMNLEFPYLKVFWNRNK